MQIQEEEQWVVYEAINIKTRKVYSGMSGHVMDRWNKEKGELKKGVSFNICTTHPILRSCKNHGIEAFRWRILCIVDSKEEAIRKE